MKMMVQHMLLLCWFMLMSLTEAYPVESKPLNNNPDTWNFGDGWLIFNPRNSADPSASALISSDPHVKKSKITPKSIFIAPNAYTGTESFCPHGFRVDDNGKCIKTVTINQDDIIAARLSELFKNDDNPNKTWDVDTDYDYNFADDTKSEKDSGPLQITIPLAIDIEEDADGKKVEYVIEEKIFTMRNLDPKDLVTTTETEKILIMEKPEERTKKPEEEPKISETTTRKPEVKTRKPEVTTRKLEVTTRKPEEHTKKPEDKTRKPEEITTLESEDTTITTTSTPLTATELMEETATVTETILPDSTTTTEDDVISTTTYEPVTVSSTTTQDPSTTTAKQVKIFSVDFLPKTQRKSNRMGDRPRKQKTTVSPKFSEKTATKLYKIDQDIAPKKNRTRNGSKRRKTTTTEAITELPVTTPQTPNWGLPKGWSFDDTKEKPVLVRFWAQQPLPHDERARSHSRRQRVNSRMPSDNIFREITATELETIMKK